MTEGVVARVPKEIKKDIEFFAKKEHTDKSNIIRRLLTRGIEQERLEYALEEYRKRNVSVGRAAELAKLPLIDFMKIAAERKIPINYSLASIRSDFEAAKRDA